MRGARGRVLTVLMLVAMLQLVPGTGSLPIHTTPQAAAQVAARGAGIFVAKGGSQFVDVFDGVRRVNPLRVLGLSQPVMLEHFDARYFLGNAFGAGDVDGNGSDEILVADHLTGWVFIRDQAGVLLPDPAVFVGFNAFDGFATGNLIGDDADEIIIAHDDISGGMIFARAYQGNWNVTFNGGFRVGDDLAAGDVNGDGHDEIVVAHNDILGGKIDVFDAGGNRPSPAFDGGFTPGDRLATADLDGDGTDEILVAHDDVFGGKIDVFDMDGNRPFPAFGGGFGLFDGFATGDLDGDGTDEILTAHHATGMIDIFDAEGNRPFPRFRGDFSLGDGFVVPRHAYPDSDGDGLFDEWEMNGLDVDGVHLDLPGWGADPNHKDLFLELDWFPGEIGSGGGEFGPLDQQEIQDLKEAFAAAPVDAGGVANPDGQPGINLWVDTGKASYAALSEDGVENSCLDGLDNGGDGLTDADDPDCLVGDDLGGGNEIQNPPHIDRITDTAFYDVKRDNFSPTRATVFRYAVLADWQSEGFLGEAELGGNDFVLWTGNPGTIMHEFGHDLGLWHGGFEPHNCKPNYVSVMNYQMAHGIPQVGGGSLLDYSPPRLVDATGNIVGRGLAPLPKLNEGALDESKILDGTDAHNQTVFSNGTSANSSLVTVTTRLDQPIDWDTDGQIDLEPVKVNLDVGRWGCPLTAEAEDALEGYDDWTNISLPFRGFGDSASGPVNPVDEPEPTIEALRQTLEAINTTDLAISVADAPDPVAAGTPLAYTITVKNNGPNPANETQVVDTLPADVAYVSGTPGCSASGAQVTCDLGWIPAGSSRQISITTAVPADLVYTNGGPKTISNSATVDNMAGPDPTPGNDTDTATTEVFAQADLAITSYGVSSAPSEIIMGASVPVTLTKVITNHGPSAPMDVSLSGTAAASTGATVTPTSSSGTESALGLEEQRTLSEGFTLACSSPGTHTFTFASQIAPSNPEDSDPVSTNDSGRVTFQAECVVPVRVNIKPGSAPNSIGLRDSSVSVAVLTTRLGEYGLPSAFNASTIDPLSVRFGTRAQVNSGGGAFEIHGVGHLQDAFEMDERTKDGDIDMVLHFKPSQTWLAVGNLEACVKGRFLGTSGNRFTFFGCDAIRVVK